VRIVAGRIKTVIEAVGVLCATARMTEGRNEEQKVRIVLGRIDIIK
jgi:hypothetical protein